MAEQTILKIPTDRPVKELPASIVWFHESGILYSVAKNVAQSIDEAKMALSELKEFTGNQRVCILSDNTNSPPTNKEMRDFAAEIIPDIAKAIAILSRSAVGKVAANLFFSLKKQPYPVKFFNSEEEARKWLMQYK